MEKNVCEYIVNKIIIFIQLKKIKKIYLSKIHPQIHKHE